MIQPFALTATLDLTETTNVTETTEISTEHADRPSLPNAPFRVLLVEDKHAGARLDRFLVDTVPELSRARVKAMIEDGQVRLNGYRARKGDAVAVGQVVELLAPPPFQLKGTGYLIHLTDVRTIRVESRYDKLQ